MRYRLIEAEKAEHRISRLCTVLGVRRQGFYAWRRRGPSLRQLGDEELKRLIVTIYDGSLQTYGAQRVQLDLAEDLDPPRRPQAGRAADARARDPGRLAARQ